jgi:hypothetical protein
MTERTFDRIPRFDPRSRQFRAFAGPALTPAALHSKRWATPDVLDQGVEGACVGFALTHGVLTEPVSANIGKRRRARYAKRVYKRAKRIDEWPGVDYEGTSVLAGLKVLKAAKAIAEYRWCFGFDEVLTTLAEHGPVVLGIWWYAGMNNPESGRARVRGKRQGGHAILCNGVDTERRTVVLHNSWGPTWGKSGAAMLSWDDLARLLSDEGEAALLVPRRSRGTRG